MTNKYLREGWHEFLIPVESTRGVRYLRVWIEMRDVVPMLRRLDERYGDDEHPYALRVEDLPEAQRDLLEMVIVHVISKPETVRRIAAQRDLAAELSERFGVRTSDYPLAYPSAIDQVDLDIGQMTLALPFIVQRSQPLRGER